MRKRIQAFFSKLMIIVMCTMLIAEDSTSAQHGFFSCSQNALSGRRGETKSSLQQYDCFWFGSYPATEISEDSQVFQALRKLPTSSWTDGDCVYQGVRYRRLRRADAVVAQDTTGFYSWSVGYHYFAYEPIKWRILKKQDNQVLLLSESILDTVQYCDSAADAAHTTWETSSMRTWLAQEFMDRAFSAWQQQAICETSCANVPTENAGLSDEQDTLDHVFLLSAGEIADGQDGFPTPQEEAEAGLSRRASCTDYGYARGVFCAETSGHRNGVWWLRTRQAKGKFRYVDCGGVTDVNRGFWGWSESALWSGAGVRPALWLDISEDGICTDAGTVSLDQTSDEKAAFSLHAPYLLGDTSGKAEKVLWDSVWFGTYPQEEVTAQESPALYRLLQESAEDAWRQNYYSYGNIRFLRMYDEENAAWRYFYEEKVRWRVLAVHGEKILLLADQILDTAPYHSSDVGVTWQESTLCSWLNTAQDGPGAMLLTSEEATAVGEDGILLPSDADLINAEYGFVPDVEMDDAARVFPATAYSSARGLDTDAANPSAARSWCRLDTRVAFAPVVNEKGVILRGQTPVIQAGNGVIPMMWLDASQTSLWTYAGTIGREGEDWIVSETTLAQLEADEEMRQPATAGAVTEMPQYSTSPGDTGAPGTAEPVVSPGDTGVPGTAEPVVSPGDTGVPGTAKPVVSPGDTGAPGTIEPVAPLGDSSAPETTEPVASPGDSSVPETAEPVASPGDTQSGANQTGSVASTTGALTMSWSVTWRQKGYLLLRWQSTDDTQMYGIFRRQGGEKKFSLLAVTSAGQTQYKDYEIRPGKVCRYRLAVVKRTDSGECFGEMTAVKRRQVPNQPSVLQAVCKRSGRRLIFHWRRREDIAGVVLVIYKKQQGSWKKISRGQWCLRDGQHSISLRIMHASGRYRFRLRCYQMQNGQKRYAAKTKDVNLSF